MLTAQHAALISSWCLCRYGRPTGAAGGATPWNDPAGSNANVSVANPDSARKGAAVYD